MNNTKFESGDLVAYKPVTPAGIDMKMTNIIGYQDDCLNPWELQFSRSEGKSIPVKVDSPRTERRYVIAHYYGWYPHTQPDLNEELDLKHKMRYYFAFESELSRRKGRV